MWTVEIDTSGWSTEAVVGVDRGSRLNFRGGESPSEKAALMSKGGRNPFKHMVDGDAAAAGANALTDA